MKRLSLLAVCLCAAATACTVHEERTVVAPPPPPAPAVVYTAPPPPPPAVDQVSPSRDEYGFRYDAQGNRINAAGQIISPHSTQP
jgi:hypothetical protein